MPAIPKSILNFGADLATTWMPWRLRLSAVAAQAKTLRVLTRQLARTAQGREYGITPTLAYGKFARLVKPVTYESLAPQLERIYRGESDVLWPGPCTLFTRTAGTATPPKYLPVTPAMIQHYRVATLASLYFYTARIGHTGIFRGRQLFLGGNARLTSLPVAAADHAACGDLSAIAVQNLSPRFKKYFSEPSVAIAQIEDWSARLDAIVARTQYRDITMLAGLPNWLTILIGRMLTRARKGNTRTANLQDLWPNFECLVHGGTSLASFTDELKLLCGPGVRFHEVYPASEGFVAAQDAKHSLGLRLMTDVGIFYEFLPLPEYDSAPLAQLGPKAVPLESVKPGVDYVMLMTTPAGLCRYVNGDIVRFISTKPPRLIYVGQTKLRLNSFGERVLEKEITDALLKVCLQHGWRLINFHVAPLIIISLTGHNRGRHEWWVELKPGTVITPTGPTLAIELDAELQRISPGYAAKRQTGDMEDPIVRLVMPGIFAHWMQETGLWGDLHKMPRCRSDRTVADRLAEIARFTAD
ncbi:MAG: GH3 auxin-responsive promoter family protein [Cephaloticoccus sp.]|nr:GH3 auxin-responsive promoter family protein [Cephaloticoccus sp.]MCF7760140.1 GH3 auxin-responsive promoter family protein [Cephaloticoccus sp.]